MFAQLKIYLYFMSAELLITRYLMQNVRLPTEIILMKTTFGGCLIYIIFSIDIKYFNSKILNWIKNSLKLAMWQEITKVL